MGACAPNQLHKLMKKYGEANIKEYFMATVGQKLISDKFLNLKTIIEEKVNLAGGISPQNVAMFDSVINKINTSESEQLSKVKSMMPSIPELDNATQSEKDKFMKTANKRYAKDIKQLQQKIGTQLEDVLDPSVYLKDVNL